MANKKVTKKNSDKMKLFLESNLSNNTKSANAKLRKPNRTV